MYDDFKVRNTGYFTLHTAVIELTVSQEGRNEKGSVRIAELAPDAEVDVLEFDVKKHGGTVTVQGSILADEGKADWQQRL